MESDSNILKLIHLHLIESHLLQTARTLEKETGEKFATPELRLKHIVNTYQSLSELLSGLLPNVKDGDVNNNIQNDAVATKNDEKATTKSDDTETASEMKAITKKTNSKIKTAKAKNKTVKEEPKKPLSVDKTDEPEKTAEEKIKSKNTKSKETKQTTKKKTVTDEKDINDKTEKSKDTLPKKEPPKRKEKPPPIPHEWLFPEMESVLSQIFENLKNKDGTLTNKKFGTSSETKPKSEKMIKMTDKIDLDFEESDSNLPKEAVEQVLIRLSNGDVYESPSGRKRESGAKEKKVEDKASSDTKVEEPEDLSETKTTSKKKKKKKAKDEEQMESKPVQKDILLIAEETSTVEEEDSNKSKSKKKKQKRNHDEVEEEPKEESEPKHSKKKKKSKVSIEEEKQSVEQTKAEELEQVVENGVVEAGDETIKPKKKKKKKNKDKEDQNDTRAIDFHIDEKENDIEDSQNDFVTPRKKDLKTPMKKSTPFQRVKEDLIQIDEKLTDNSYEAKVC